MSKFTTIAGLAVVAIGLSTISGGSAFAARLHTGSLPALSLTHDAMLPNQGFGYDKAAYDAQAAQGNGGARTTEEPFTSDWQQNRSNEARHSHG